MKYFFSSDYHFSHANILKYCYRLEFMNTDEKNIMLHGSDEDRQKLKISDKSLTKMNETIIYNHNSRVKSEDNFFHLGDFCFRNSPGGKQGEGTTTKAEYWESKLNGKIIYISGNHDRNNGVPKIIQGILIKHCNHQIYMVHKPEHYNPAYEINFVGHVHNNWAVKLPGEIIHDAQDKEIVLESTLINVGVDVNKFMPITFEEAIGNLKRYKNHKIRGAI